VSTLSNHPAVLVAGADGALHAVLSSTLREEGLRVVSVPSAAEAAELVGQAPHHGIVLATASALEQVRPVAHSASVPLLVVSPCSDEREIWQAIRQGLDRPQGSAPHDLLLLVRRAVAAHGFLAHRA